MRRLIEKANKCPTDFGGARKHKKRRPLTSVAPITEPSGLPTIALQWVTRTLNDDVSFQTPRVGDILNDFQLLAPAVWALLEF